MFWQETKPNLTEPKPNPWITTATATATAAATTSTTTTTTISSSNNSSSSSSSSSLQTTYKLSMLTLLVEWQNLTPEWDIDKLMLTTSFDDVTDS